jgi:hypothetical protein
MHVLDGAPKLHKLREVLMGEDSPKTIFSIYTCTIMGIEVPGLEAKHAQYSNTKGWDFRKLTHKYIYSKMQYHGTKSTYWMGEYKKLAAQMSGSRC